MKMVGHKTESIYRRYAIADESILLKTPLTNSSIACYRSANSKKSQDKKTGIGKVLTSSTQKMEFSRERRDFNWVGFAGF